MIVIDYVTLVKLLHKRVLLVSLPVTLKYTYSKK